MSASKKHLKPVYETFIDDVNTPVSAYIKLKQPTSFLLESVSGGERVARYSFIGLTPFCEYICDQQGTITCRTNGNVETLTGNPIDELQRLLSQYHIDEHPDIPRFLGGAVGYFSWETIGYIEDIHFDEKNGVEMPLMHMVFPKELVIFDHAKRSTTIVVLTQSDNDIQDAKDAIQAIKDKLNTTVEVAPIAISEKSQDELDALVTPNYDKAGFCEAVEKGKHYIHEGDVFQLVLSQQFQIHSDKDSFDIYRTLRGINPSPYMFYMAFDDYTLIGSSPEILSRVDNGKAVVRPLAGSRPRIPGREEALKKELLADDKERAEHIMLVDLGRNDLGRVCDYETVKTTDLMSVEEYSHIMHIVSTVEGELRPDKSAVDVFKATFPAGTLSGAPKIRAVEIIEEIEPDRRGAYGGALGYFDCRGNMDLCIIIRTIFQTKSGYKVQAGAGIVADSVPETEYEECWNKARGMIKACF